jgi:hypothetical protein
MRFEDFGQSEMPCMTSRIRTGETRPSAKLNLRWFVRLGLHHPVEEAIEERAELAGRVVQVRVLLRHELMHVADMLDPAFGYERSLPTSDDGPSADNIVRDRYRVLWDVTIDGRLARAGLAHPDARAAPGRADPPGDRGLCHHSPWAARRRARRRHWPVSTLPVPRCLTRTASGTPDRRGAIDD